MKKCLKCGNPCEEYRCGDCRRSEQREYMRKNKDNPEYKKRIKENASRWYLKHRERVIRETTEKAILRRKFAIDSYGGKCICCGELEYKFLTFDHCNNDGSKHRKEIGSVSTRHFVDWIIKNNFPITIQLLCYNCNCGKAYNKGICPHKM